MRRPDGRIGLDESRDFLVDVEIRDEANDLIYKDLRLVSDIRESVPWAFVEDTNLSVVVRFAGRANEEG